MKTNTIPKGVLENTFQCAEDYSSYVRLDCWGEGSCFFHSVALLTVISNKLNNDHIIYTLYTPNSKYSTFKVQFHPNIPFAENFRQVGIMLRQRLGAELKQSPGLWDQFIRQNHINQDRTDKVQTVQGAIQELHQIETWADIWTIRYCAWRMQLNLLFVNPSSSQEPIYCGVENFQNQERTFFIYWSNHSHFEPIVQISNGEVVRSFGQNHAFLKCLRSQYKQSCPFDPIGK